MTRVKQNGGGHVAVTPASFLQAGITCPRNSRKNIKMFSVACATMQTCLSDSKESTGETCSNKVETAAQGTHSHKTGAGV